MDRYCIKCGKITTKKNDSCYVCEAGHENWVNPAVGAIVYIVKDGKVLFGVRSVEPNSGKMSLPGGFVNVNETAEQAAVREAKEELGVNIALQTCLGTYATTYGDRPILNIVFVASCENQSITPGDDMSGGEPAWREVESLPAPDELAWDWYQAAQKDLLAWWAENQDRSVFDTAQAN
jgi:ADP-ribose pyrophosphatase YjhB (NUDIX family)